MPSVTVPDDFGTITYNGYSFHQYAKSSVSVSFVQDKAERTIKYVKYTITVDDVIFPTPANPAAHTEIEAAMEDVRQKLSESGGAITFSNRGFGDFSFTDSDVLYGPFPKVLQWRPIGPNMGARVHWQVEVTVRRCEVLHVEVPLDFSYSVVHQVDRWGMTTRTVSGQIEMPAYRDSANPSQVTNHVDGYLYLLDGIPPLVGFERHQSHNVDDSKRRLDFSIVDRQINEYPRPHQVIDIDIRASIDSGRSAGSGGFNKWHCTLTGSISTRADIHLKSTCWIVFLEILQARLSYAPRGKRAVAKANNNLAEPVKNNVAEQGYLIDRIRIEEDVYGRPTSFHIGYTLLHNLDTILKSSGMWTPVPGDWGAWSIAAASNQHRTRGYAQLAHGISDDIIMDVCEGSINPPTIADGPSVIVKPSEPDPEPLVLPNGPPSASTSYLEFMSHVELDSTSNVIRHQKLPETAVPVGPTSSGFGPTPSGFDPNDPNYAGFVNPHGSASIQEDIVQTVAHPQHKIRLSGHAVRAGFPIPVPTLKSVSGVDLTETSRNAVQTILTTLSGIPIYALKWLVEYIVPTPPTVVPVSPNYAAGEHK